MSWPASSSCQPLSWKTWRIAPKDPRLIAEFHQWRGCTLTRFEGVGSPRLAEPGATVDIYRAAGGKAGILAGEISHCACDFLWPRKALHYAIRGDGGFHLFGQGRVDRSLGRTGVD